MERFPIGFWNYMPIQVQDAASVKDWADAGMTLALSPKYGSEPEQIAKMRSILDVAAEKGIYVILCDQRSSWQYLMNNDERLYRDHFRQAVVDLGGHPAVLGFHVGDEPDSKNFPFACQAIRIQKEIAPELSPFCNLFPWYPGVATCVGYENWGSYLDEYVNRAKSDFLCYDCYTQLVPGDENMDMYFRNLREYSEAARRHRIPFWTTLLSVGHFRYRCPREDDFRWQINTAIAHGAKGLLWFFFYMQWLDNYRVSPIDEHGERTETFQWLSRVNRTFLKTHAGIIKDLELQKVSHTGRAWGGYPLLDGRDLVINAASKHGTGLILSEFRHKNGNNYVAVVNNSQTDSAQIDLWIRGRRPKLHRIVWLGNENPVICGDGWNVEQGEDFIAIHPWLAPGQMELYRVEFSNK